MEFFKFLGFYDLLSTSEPILPALEWLQEQSRFFYLKEYDIRTEYFALAFIGFALLTSIHYRLMKSFNKTQDVRQQKFAHLLNFIKIPLFLVAFYSWMIKCLFLVGLYMPDYRAKSLLDAPFYQELSGQQQVYFRSYMNEYAKEKQDDNGRTYYAFNYFDISGVLKRMVDNGEIQFELTK